MFAAELPPNQLVKVTIIVNGISFYLNIKVNIAMILHSELLTIMTYFTLHRPVMISALCMEEIVRKSFCKIMDIVLYIKLAALLTELTQGIILTIHLVILIQS